MPRFVPISIEKQGLEAFLNSKADEHRGLGFREFNILAQLDKKGKRIVNTSNLARAFNVSRPTMERWLEIYQQKPAV